MDTGNTSLVAVSPEAKTWARRMIEQYRAVETLHSAQPRWHLPGVDGSWGEQDDALAALWESRNDDTLGPEHLEFFLVCGECARIEQSLGLDQGLSWSYLNSMWPCATSRALHDGEE